MNVRVGLVGILSVSALATFSSGCSSSSSSSTGDADHYRDAVPQTADMGLAVPGSSTASASGSTGTQHAGGIQLQNRGGGIHTQDVTTADGKAQFYDFTRNITDAVDAVTAVILGGIDAIVAQPPTSISGNEAVWGPWQGDALEPVTWRFTVTEIAPNAFNFALVGRPKASTAESDFVTVMNGHGYGKEAGALHRTGWFQVDNDAYRNLDPARGHDYGTTKITFDLKNLDDPTQTGEIDVDLEPGAAKGNLSMTVLHQPGGAGELDVTGKAAMDSTKPTILEDVVLKNRWEATGAGRADVNATGGNLPSQLTVVECWSSSFDQVYYTDNLNVSPTVGAPSACAITK